MSVMKRLQAMIVAFLFLFTLTGCVKFDLALEVHSDSTVSGSLIYAISDSLAELGTSSEDTDPTEDLFDETAEGITTNEYKENGYTGTRISLDRVPLEAFNQPSGESGGLQITRKGNQITLTGELDLSSTDTSDTSDSDWGDALTKSLFASADLDISVKFPVKVLSSTGTISQDGRTVSWKPQIGEKIDLTTTVEIPNKRLMLVVIVGVLLIAFVGLSFVIGILKIRRSKAKLKDEDESSI